MVRAQCYYEILGIEDTASSDDIKKAYRSLALVWHPDKNQANPEEAHAKFQTILKAYETLSDSRERDWYDRHKDQILSDGDNDGKDDKCINLFQYFSSSCYANFDDSDDGFYTIYRNVFDQITKEEEQAIRLVSKLSKDKQKKLNEGHNYPCFGDSNSDYDNIVKPFYAYWSGFCTNVTFDQLDKYNTTEADNRRILRAMEKENKKLKDQAKKERNTNVRNLVEFVKKRDKRLKAHKLLVEKQNKFNREKTAEKQRIQREKIQKESREYKPTAWDDVDEIEQQLRQLESQYDHNDKKKARQPVNDTSVPKACQNNSDDGPILANIGDDDDPDGDEDLDDVDFDDDDTDEEPDLFCPACSKEFKSINAFENHESSKKHKQNVIKLKRLLEDEERKLKVR